MRIVLHILLKDLRRHWREIGLYVLCCAGWTWEVTHPLSWIWTHQRETLPIAMFGLWGFVTIRVVHSECLVGDREFWQTRPYRWGQLLAAKTLLLVLCLNLPLLTAQVVLLAWAGIPFSWPLVSGLLFLQLEFVFFATFPTWVLAAVTESLVQWVLAVVGLFLCGLFLSWLPWDMLPHALAGEEEVATVLGGAVIVPALLFALVWQYARRRVRLARLAIAFAGLVVPVVIALAPTGLVRYIVYQRSADPTQFNLTQRPVVYGGVREYLRKGALIDQDTIEIPINFSSTDPDVIVDVEGLRVLLTGDNGWRWQSPWINPVLDLSAISPGGSFQFDMPRQFADQLSQRHVSSAIDVAYKMHKLGRALRIDTSPSQFSIPGVAYCHWLSGNRGVLFLSGYTCVAPLRLPGLMIAQIDSHDSKCPAEEGEPPIAADHYASDATYGNDETPADFDPSPIRQLSFRLGEWVPPVHSSLNPRDLRRASLCRGTPLFVRFGTYAGRMRSSFNLGPIGSEKLVEGRPSDNVLQFSTEGR